MHKRMFMTVSAVLAALLSAPLADTGNALPVAALVDGHGEWQMMSQGVATPLLWRTQFAAAPPAGAPGRAASNGSNGNGGPVKKPFRRKRQNFSAAGGFCVTTGNATFCATRKPKPRKPRKKRYVEHDGMCCHRHVVPARMRVNGRLVRGYLYGRWHCHPKPRFMRHCASALQKRVNHPWMK